MAAAECERRAAAALTGDGRRKYLRLQRNWLKLAQSYEFAERLLDFSKENKKRRAEFYGDFDE
jgi:hypothetical protein